jgi:hypothetical protein
VLGLNNEFIGLIEGSLTTIVSFAKIGAGYLSDVLGMRKTIVFVGSGGSAMGMRLNQCIYVQIEDY